MHESNVCETKSWIQNPVLEAEHRVALGGSYRMQFFMNLIFYLDSPFEMNTDYFFPSEPTLMYQVDSNIHLYYTKEWQIRNTFELHFWNWMDVTILFMPCVLYKRRTIKLWRTSGCCHQVHSISIVWIDAAIHFAPRIGCNTKAHIHCLSIDECISTADARCVNHGFMLYKLLVQSIFLFQIYTQNILGQSSSPVPEAALSCFMSQERPAPAYVITL